MWEEAKMSRRKRCTALLLTTIVFFLILSVPAHSTRLDQRLKKSGGPEAAIDAMAQGNNLHPRKARLAAHAKAGTTDPLDVWVWRNPLPQGDTLNNIGYGKNTFVAVGEVGAILTSPNGATWTSTTSGANGPLYGVTFASSTFVAVGYDDYAGTGAILTSPDGTTWTSMTSGTAAGLYSVAYGSSTFVAVGYDNSTGTGTILTSPDGAAWTPITSGTTAGLYGVTFSGGAFVAVGDGGTILTSPDGAAWNDVSLGTGGTLYGVAFATRSFVAVGDGGTILTSPDGATWNDVSPGTTAGLKGVACGSGTFVAVGYTGAILTSPAGATWTSRTSGTTAGLYSVAYGSSAFVTVGYDDSAGISTILISPDGTTWNDVSPGTTGALYGVTFANGTFAAVGYDYFAGAGTILTSPEGTTWNDVSPGTGALYGVTFANGTFAAVGYDDFTGAGTILTSPEGTNWTTRTSVTTNGLYGIAYGPGSFVTVGDGGTILQSVAVITHVLTVTPKGTGSGTVTSNPSGITCGATCSASFSQGVAVTLTASADTGSIFAGWSGGCQGTGICSVTMNSDITVTATFTLKTYTLTATKSGSGVGTLSAPGLTCSGASCSGPYPYNTTVNITATALTGSTFAGWTGCDSGSGNTCTVTVTGSKSVSARFTLNAYSLIATKTGSGVGTLSATGLTCSGATCSGTYNYNTPVAITATAGADSAFTRWTGCDSSPGNICRVTMNGDKSVEAGFVAAYTVTASAPGGHGSVKPVTQKVGYGGSASITIAPEAGYHIASITDNGQPVAIANQYVVSDVTAGHTIVVAFSLTTDSLTIQPGGDGTGKVTSSPLGINCGVTCTHKFRHGAKVILTATAIGRSTFTGWSGGGCPVKGTCQVTMTSDTSVTATFAAPVTLTIQPGGDGQGTITSSPLGITCRAGGVCSAGFKLNSLVTLTAVPAANSYFSGWGGSCRGARATCTVTMAHAAAVNANFSADPRISVTPASRNFIHVPAHQTRSQVFIVTNTGKSILSLATLSLTGNPFFTLNPGKCDNANLGPGKTCAFAVVFKPLDTISVSATVSIPSNDQVTPLFAVPISGNSTGVGAAEEDI